jgi:hypothetical protein
LKEVCRYAHTELNKVKRVSSKFHMLVTLNCIEKWLHEVEKDYQEA